MRLVWVLRDAGVPDAGRRLVEHIVALDYGVGPAPNIAGSLGWQT